jgi:hypothetical protein
VTVWLPAQLDRHEHARRLIQELEQAAEQLIRPHDLRGPFRLREPRRDMRRRMATDRRLHKARRRSEASFDAPLTSCSSIRSRCGCEHTVQARATSFGMGKRARATRACPLS